MERHSFNIVLGDALRNCAFPQIFHSSKLGEITEISTDHTDFHIKRFLQEISSTVYIVPSAEKWE